LLTDDSRTEIARYYSELIAPMFGMAMTPQQGEKMLLLFKRFMRLTDDHTGLKYHLIRFIELLKGNVRSVSAFIRPKRERKREDWLNRSKNFYLSNRRGTELVNYTVEEMTENAYRDAIALITNFNAFMTLGVPLDPELYLRNYSGDLTGE